MTKIKTPADSLLHSPIKSLEILVDETLNVFQECKKIPQLYDTSFEKLEKSCHDILKSTHSQQLKIAVAGSIKSGKSTFINSLVGKDLVKRGAGVVTSITTRIRKGKKNRANIYFKSWDKINLQLQKALELFPLDAKETEITDTDLSQIDIRRKKDRIALKKILKILTCDFPVTQQGIQPETLLIQHAIKGFDSCKSLVQSDETSLVFESKKFNQYKDFISDPDNAFYIKDVCLELYGKIINSNLEIADCQGADSIDPGQLAQILSYLESSNLIIYCVSSRTGLRQADIIFLNQIKKLGLLDNTIFINNCDLSEHEDLNNLIKIETDIKNNLKFLEIKPKIFSFSALYNLFIHFSIKGKSNLTKKDLIRLKLWQEDAKMVEYCNTQTEKFTLFYKEAIDKNRQSFLVSNHFNRIKTILSHLLGLTDIFSDLLSSDKKREEEAMLTLTRLEKNAKRIENIVKKAIGVNILELKEKIHLNLKDAFVQDSTSILSNTLDYINNAAPIDVEQYKSNDKSGFNQIFYLMFQDFKRQLDLYVLENIKPAMNHFVKTQEEEIQSFFNSLFDSFQIEMNFDQNSDRDIDQDINQYITLEKDNNISDSKNLSNDCTDFNEVYYDGVKVFETIKKILNLQIPAPVFEAKYTPKIKTSVFTDFSLQIFSGILSYLVKQNRRVFSFSPGLKKAANKIKLENLKQIKVQYEQYYINLENEYFIPLIEAVTRDFKDKINERFGLYSSYSKEVESVLALKQFEKLEQKENIKSISQQIQHLSHNIICKY